MPQSHEFITLEQITNAKYSEEISRAFIPSYFNKSDYKLISDEMKLSFNLNKSKAMSVNAMMTYAEFSDNVVKDFNDIIEKYRKKDIYKYLQMLEDMQKTISTIEYYKEDYDILTTMIVEFKQREDISKSTMLFYNKLCKQIYGDNNE